MINDDPHNDWPHLTKPFAAPKADVLVTSEQLFRCKRCVVVLKEVKDIADQISARNPESAAKMQEINGDMRELVGLLKRIEAILKGKS